jgi:hypothetical protein
VPKQEIVAWLELYGSVESELIEDCYKDSGDLDRTNRTRNYSIKIKLDIDNPLEDEPK